MVCRNKDQAEEARADIVKESGNKVQCDLHTNNLLHYHTYYIYNMKGIG